MKKIISLSSFRLNRGMTLLEMLVALSIMAAILVLVLESLRFMAGSTKSALASADLTTRTTGTLYDIVAELRQATAQSPHFYVEQDITRPPSITFDLVAGVDGKGNILWGNTVTYALQMMPLAESKNFQHLNVDAGQLIRIETDSAGVTTTFLVEDCVPYRYIEMGVTYWGFSVSCDDCAISLSLSRFADNGLATTRKIQNASDGTLAVGTLSIVRTSGTYFLRNPQSVIVLQ